MLNRGSSSSYPNTLMERATRFGRWLSSSMAAWTRAAVVGFNPPLVRR